MSKEPVPENLLTVPQFAQKAGLSKQAVYQKLKCELKDYYTVINRQKYIDKSALDAVRVPSTRTDEQLLMAQIKAKDEQIAHLQAALSRLEELQSSKDAQIQLLTDDVKHYRAENEKLTNQQENFQILIQNSQKLIALQSHDSNTADSMDASKEESSDTVPPPPTTQAEQAPTEEKHGFFWRLFH